jgi:hypothetical protein
MLNNTEVVSLEDIEGHQVFDSFEMFFDYVLDWLTFKNEQADGLFSEWLIKQGKSPPPEQYYKFE